VDGPASRPKFVFDKVFLGASRWPPQIVIGQVSALGGHLKRASLADVSVKRSDARFSTDVSVERILAATQIGIAGDDG
jgi:hypothetical protein